MQVILVQLIAFFAVFLFVVGLKAALSPRDRDEDKHKPGLYRTFARETTALGAYIHPMCHKSNPDQTLKLTKEIICAALTIEVVEIRGMQLLSCLTLGVAGGAMTFLASLNIGYTVLATLLLGYLGWIYPPTSLASAAKNRQDEMSGSLPFSIDLLTVAMEAGQDFTAALRHLVTEGLRGPLADEFNVMLRQMELGKNRVDALKAMAERIQLDDFQSLVTSVVQSSEMGSSIAATLKIQAEEIRRARFHKAERKAARAPSLMLIPMALFILPAVFIIIFTPIFIRSSAAGGLPGN